MKINTIFNKKPAVLPIDVGKPKWYLFPKYMVCFWKEVCMMMNLTFTTAYGFVLILNAIILGSLGTGKNSVDCRGQN